jgi:lysophospholipase L1-like esterase
LQTREGSVFELGHRARRAVTGAFVAPAFVLLWKSGATLLGSADVPTVVILESVAGLGLLLSVLAPGPRRLYEELGKVLLARIGTLGFLYAAMGLWVFDGGRTSWQCAEVLILGLACVAAVSQAELDPRRLGRLGLLLTLQLVLLAAADTFVRVAVLPLKSQNSIFAAYDPDLGWKLRANLSARHTTGDHTTTETVNSLGFRTPERPFAKPAGTKRVLIIGDSHTEAYVVDDGETYPELLERSLAAAGPTEVIALGVGGWSTDQELLAYVHYGQRFDPDLVLLQFCPNDPPFNALDRYWRGRKPRFVRQGEQLFLTGVPVPNTRNSGLFSGALLEHSALALLAESILRRLSIEHEVAAEADSEEGWQITALLVRDLAHLVHSNGSRFAAFNAQVRGAPEVDGRFRAILREHGVPYLETDGAFTDDYEGYWIDGHWNPKGQRAVAEFLAPQVRAALTGDSH